jgi:hypothetical protein
MASEDVEEGAWWWWTRRRSGHHRVCGRLMTGLGFRGLGTLKRRIVATGMMTSSTPIAIYELSLPVATVVMPIATVVMPIAIMVMPVATDY